tara:strand:- start:838 stop:1797 length:960 start_codon:yes stop_codon:yes gene_type:complete
MDFKQFLKEFDLDEVTGTEARKTPEKAEARRKKQAKRQAGGIKRKKKVRGKRAKAEAEAAKPKTGEILPPEPAPKPAGAIPPPKPKTIDVTAREKDPVTGFEKNPGRKLGDTKDQPTPEEIKRRRVAKVGKVLRSAHRRGAMKRLGGLAAKSAIEPGGGIRTAISQALVPIEVRGSGAYQAMAARRGGASNVDMLRRAAQSGKTVLDRRKQRLSLRQARRGATSTPSSGQEGSRGMQLAAHRVYDRLGDILGEDKAPKAKGFVRRHIEGAGAKLGRKLGPKGRQALRYLAKSGIGDPDIPLDNPLPDVKDIEKARQSGK